MPNEQIASLVASELITQMLCALQFVVRQMFKNCRKKEPRLYTIWASTRENLSLGVYEQKRHRPACASMQTHQHLCHLLFGKYHI